MQTHNISLGNDAIYGLGAVHCHVFGAISYERVDWVLEAFVERRVAPAGGPSAATSSPGRSGRATRDEFTCAGDIAPQAVIEPRAQSSGSTWNAGGPHSETPWPAPPAARHRLTDGELAAVGRVAKQPPQTK